MSTKSFRIAVAQINTTLGNFQDNRKKIVESVQKAQASGCDLVVFPESTLFGYHPFDLLELPQLVDLQLKELKEIEKKVPSGIAVLVGVISKNKNKKGRPYFNSAALVQKGKKTRLFHKELLPTGDVFDEARFIEHGDLTENFFTLKGKKVFVSICEDIWAWEDGDGSSQYRANPLLKVKGRNVDLVVNLSASPFYPGKMKIRKELVKKTAAFFKAPMVYTNLVGAQDEIIFDGGSFALDESGEQVLQCSLFEEDFGVLDLAEREASIQPEIKNPSEILRKALVLGIRDFCDKVGIRKVHLGLSGGVDSALVACLAVDALGPANVTTIAMATHFNAPESFQLAEELARNLGCQFLSVPIQNAFETVRAAIDPVFDISEFNLTHENIQARIRGMVLMAYSNQKGSLLLNTSNKSEMAAGYSTLYGDMCGGLCPIGDLTKRQVYSLCEHYNSERPLIPEKILTRAPSAELRPNQKDQDSLPPYEDLDASVDRLIRDCKPIRNKTDRWLIEATLKSEFKRWQAPPILKVSQRSFGRGRRYPVAQQTRELK